MKRLLLVGAGYMAAEYARVLNAKGIEYDVVGRSEKGTATFYEKTGKNAIPDGLNKLSQENLFDRYDKAIVAVNEETASKVVDVLINNGIRKILLEKPGGLNTSEISETYFKAKATGTEIYVAYNRRFYASVLEGKKIIEVDGGVKSFNFEFTEWSHTIEPLPTPAGVKEEWFLANSTHVVDLAFFLGGKPTEMRCFTAGTSNWHPRAMIYAGAGVTDRGALFSYQANWAAPGRWAVEILTSKHRLYFKPLEKLQIQEIGSVAVDFVEIDDHLDTKFKPGLYLEVQEFLKEVPNMLTLKEHVDNFEFYNLIEGKNE